MKFPYIMGFQKCGMTSLIKYYRKQYGQSASIHATEDITSPDCVEKFLRFEKTHFPVVIIRDKIDALWSMYEFFGYNKSMTLEEFLSINKPHVWYINENPIFRIDYDFHIEKIKKYNPTILKLEEMSDDFPQENKTKNKTNLDESTISIINKALDNYNRELYL